MSMISKSKIALLSAALMVAGSVSAVPAMAQDRGNFYGGVRNGGRGGYYDRGHDHNYDRRNDQRYNDQYRHDNGVGPGKGALIGAGGGAVLGALFGGTKGALVGGAAGAGIGAIVGKNAQDNRRRNNYYGR